MPLSNAPIPVNSGPHRSVCHCRRVAAPEIQQPTSDIPQDSARSAAALRDSQRTCSWSHRQTSCVSHVKAHDCLLSPRRVEVPMSHQSAFKSPEGEAAFLAAYDAALKEWPVPFEEMTIPGRFGMTHVIASGP